MNKKDLGLLVLIVIVALGVYLRNPLFLSPNNIANTANLIGLFGLFAIAQGFVIITGGIELSAGSMIALLGVLFVDMVGRLGVPWPLAALAAIALGLLLGLAHGLLITRLKMQPFIVTLCGLLIYRGVARGYTADATAGFPFGSTYPGLDFFVARYWGIPTSVFVLVAVGIVAWIVLHRSIYGRYLFAVGKNEEAARFSGIRTNVVVASAYVVHAGLTAIAAIFFAMYTRSVQPSGHANFYELYAIAAAVLGGFSLRGGEGSVVGVVLGTILLQILQNLVNLLGIPSSLNFAVMGTVILVGVLADQQFGLYRERRRAGQIVRGGTGEPEPLAAAAKSTS
jgi:ribose transport system permease protein